MSQNPLFLIVGSNGLYLQGARPSRDRRNNSAIVTRYCKHHWKLFCLSHHNKEQRHEVSTGPQHLHVFLQEK